jgi:hypothetical protein
MGIVGVQSLLSVISLVAHTYQDTFTDHGVRIQAALGLLANGVHELAELPGRGVIQDDVVPELPTLVFPSSNLVLDCEHVVAAALRNALSAVTDLAAIDALGDG